MEHLKTGTFSRRPPIALKIGEAKFDMIWEFRKFLGMGTCRQVPARALTCGDSWLEQLVGEPAF